MIVGCAVSGACSVGLLKEVIILNPKVVVELQSQIALRSYIVFYLDHAIYLDMDSKTIGRELSVYFFVDLHKHVVRALDDTPFRLFLTDAVDQPEFVKRHLRD